jgi:hypothetical protein
MVLTDVGPCASAFPVERVGRLLQSRSISGLITPFICIPAYSFPVYASQRVSPLPTQDSVHGCWLGFAMVAIPGY